MEGSVKGTVTSISSLFSPEQAQKAVQRVQDSIADRHKELDHVREFIADNTNLVNLVQRLPDDLHHDVMVPFGKAAFFPGRLTHTNEFLVLLGEGYYAERTSKQTIEILKRRGKVLESQVESIKALVQDLKAEASFFDATASEAAEGLVEIREDYNEEDEDPTESVYKTGLLKSDSSSSVKADNIEVPVEDEQYARMMSRLDELEEQELAAESDEDEHTVKDEEYARIMSRLDELEKQELAAESDEDECDEDEHTVKDEEYARIMSRLDELKKQELSGDSLKEFDGDEHSEAYFDEVSRGKSVAPHVKNLNSTEKATLPEVKEKVQGMPRPKHEVPAKTSQPGTDSLKAFTCSIVEHTENLQTNLREQNAASSQPPGSQPSKPVSRFKMQRR